MTPEQLSEHVRTVLTELLPDRETITVGALLDAGKIVSARYDRNHRVMHADAQRGGAIIWEMRRRGLSWREIYDATGIVQRTGARWAALFEAEGIAVPGDTELRERAEGDPV